MLVTWTKIARPPHAGLLLALLAAVAVFANSLRGEFVLDDRFMIENNPRVHSWRFVPDYFTEGVWHNSGFSDLSEIPALYYRPLHLLLVRVTHAVFGVNTVGYHAVNLLLFLVNVVLVFHLTRKLLDPAHPNGEFAAAAAALIFAVHPVHTESVAWISGVTDPLAFAFALGSFAFYLRGIDSGDKKSFIASVLCFALGLLTKETVIVLPLLLIAYNALFKRPLFPASLWTFFAVIAAYLGLRAWALDASVAIAPQLEGFRFLFEFVAGYVKLLLLPWPLDYFFSVQPEAVVSMPEAVGWWAFLLAVCGWALRYRQREPLIAFGVIWIVVTLSPSLVWAFHEVPVFAVRYLYPPSIGLALIVARGFQLAKIRWPAATTATAAAVALAYAAIVVVKNGDWRNEERFFLSALAVPTQHDEYYGPPLALLGKYYYEHNRPEAAIQYFTEAEKIGDLFTKVFCNESIGLIHGERGDYVRSTEYYTRAYQLDPSKSSVLIGLGNNAFATQDARQALHYYTLAYEADKNNRAASYNLSLVYATLGDAANAMRFRRIAESISDEFVQ